jgi:hypothetical protein
MRYTPLRFANRENVGRVDHPEHHAQARPKWNGGYKLIVRLGATANKKERSCPRFLIVEFFGVRGRCQNWLKQRMDELEKTRHFIAHNRALLPSEDQRVYIADWNRVVGL